MLFYANKLDDLVRSFVRLKTTFCFNEKDWMIFLRKQKALERAFPLTDLHNRFLINRRKSSSKEAKGEILRAAYHAKEAIPYSAAYTPYSKSGKHRRRRRSGVFFFGFRQVYRHIILSRVSLLR